MMFDQEFIEDNLPDDIITRRWAEGISSTSNIERGLCWLREVSHPRDDERFILFLGVETNLKNWSNPKFWQFKFQTSCRNWFIPAETLELGVWRSIIFMDCYHNSKTDYVSDVIHRNRLDQEKVNRIGVLTSVQKIPNYLSTKASS